MITIAKVSKERIENVVKQVVPDQEAQDIIFYLRGKTNISEFIVAEELDLEIHRTRNLLYRLLDANLVSFIRKKDKIKGWYICYWDFCEDNIPYIEEKFRNETIEKLQERLNTEKSAIFYMCKYAHVRKKFEDAFETDFKCPECGELMNQMDNSRTIEFLEGRLEDLMSLAQPAKKAKAKPKSKTSQISAAVSAAKKVKSRS